MSFLAGVYTQAGLPQHCSSSSKKYRAMRMFLKINISHDDDEDTGRPSLQGCDKPMEVDSDASCTDFAPGPIRMLSHENRCRTKAMRPAVGSLKDDNGHEERISYNPGVLHPSQEGQGLRPWPRKKGCLETRMQASWARPKSQASR